MENRGSVKKHGAETPRKVKWADFIGKETAMEGWMFDFQLRLEEQAAKSRASSQDAVEAYDDIRELRRMYEEVVTGETTMHDLYVTGRLKRRRDE
jgi:hypothetical protein